MAPSLQELVERSSRRLRLPPPPVRRSIRRHAAITQDELAAVLGVHRSAIARYELPAGAGGRTPRGELRERYAEILTRLEAMPLSTARLTSEADDDGDEG